MYIDSFGLDITYKCNLRCLHCYNNSGEHNFGEELSDHELRDLLQDLALIAPRSFCFCGGEPMLRKNMILELSDAYYKLTGNKCNVVSNGLLIDDITAKALKQSNIGRIQISVDGFAEEHNWMRQNNDAYEAALSAVESLKRYGISVGVACAPSKKNLAVIDEYIVNMIDIGVDEIRMQPLMKMGRAQGIEDYFLDDIEYFRLANKIKSKSSHAFKKGCRLEWGDPTQHLVALKQLEKANFFNITAYGNIVLTPYIPIVFGNIRRHRITEYLECGVLNTPSIEFVKRVIDLIPSADQFDLHRHSSLPSANNGKDIDMDVIDNDIEQLGEQLTNKYFTV